MSSIRHLPCPNCGLQNEFVGARPLINYTFQCRGCGHALTPPPESRRVTQTSDLIIEHIPKKGLGVFAARPYEKEELIERCPAYPVVGSDISRDPMRGLLLRPYADSTEKMNLMHMAIPWVENDTTVYCIVLGYGMLYNHTPLRTQNIYRRTYVDPHTKRRYIDYIARRDIEAGEELAYTYTSQRAIWFKDQK